MKVTKGGTVSKMLAGVEIPEMFHARQTFPRESISAEEIPGIVEAQIAQPQFSEKIKPGMSIAITAGSRGIRNVDVITRAVVDAVKRRGASPFVVPAVASHGGDDEGAAPSRARWRSSSSAPRAWASAWFSTRTRTSPTASSSPAA